MMIACCTDASVSRATWTSLSIGKLQELQEQRKQQPRVMTRDETGGGGNAYAETEKAVARRGLDRLERCAPQKRFVAHISTKDV
jgi:hypothetical protein